MNFVGMKRDDEEAAGGIVQGRHIEGEIGVSSRVLIPPLQVVAARFCHRLAICIEPVIAHITYPVG